MISNFLGRVTTITSNYCLLFEECVTKISFNSLSLNLLLGYWWCFVFSFGAYSAVPHYSKELIEIYNILFCSPPVDEPFWLLKMVSL